MSNAVLQPNNIVYVASCVAAIGGLLFGYDMGIISGAKSQLQRDLKLSCGQVESVVTMLPIGALVASLLGGFQIIPFFQMLF
jgi:SP family facilitated glucose transporter-like MFS transporter 12